MADVGFQNGSIQLEEVRAVYYSGQTINGSVVFDLRDQLHFSVLHIQYLGEANVQWSYTQIDTINGNERRSQVQYRGHEAYFNYTHPLAGGQGISQLPPRHHSFPFKYQIPFACPSSFRGPKGNVTYKIIATMVYPNMRQEVLEREITIISPLDLNTGNPALKEPVDMELEELSPCSWCFESGSVCVRIRLPVTGYCPGQTIPINIEVHNSSNVEITDMLFEILTKEMYHSQQPSSEFVVPGRVLASVKKGAIMSNSKKNFTCDLIVPDMIVPYMEFCNIIDIGYFFRATVSLSGCNDEMQEEAEICLGLVPLRETLTGEYVHPKADSLPSGPIPVNDGSTAANALRVPTPVHHGSYNNINQPQPNLNRSQPNLNQDYPPPYPGGNAPYPTDNKYRNSTGDIGFRTPEKSANNPPYPTSNVMPTVTSYPYPTGGSSHVSPPYPTNTDNNSGLPSYTQASFAPSAPPAAD